MHYASTQFSGYKTLEHGPRYWTDGAWPRLLWAPIRGLIKRAVQIHSAFIASKCSVQRVLEHEPRKVFEW